MVDVDWAHIGKRAGLSAAASKVLDLRARGLVSREAGSAEAEYKEIGRKKGAIAKLLQAEIWKRTPRAPINAGSITWQKEALFIGDKKYIVHGFIDLQG